MKFFRVTTAVLAALLCLPLYGCHSSSGETSSPSQSPGSQALPSEDEISGFQTDPSSGLTGPVLFTNSGAVRVSYTGNVSSAVYVTSPSQLPACEALQKYDDAYFQDHGLILVYESVSGGSTEVGIQSIDIDGSEARITLFHQTPEETGTTVMTTWLLWAEVDAGLDCRWTVVNPALKTDHATS